MKQNRRIFKTFLVLTILFLLGISIFNSWKGVADTPISQPIQDEISTRIEAALYARAEFFEAKAVVPIPTAEARQRLAKLQNQFPDSSKIVLILAQLDEKLGNTSQAEADFNRSIELEKESSESLERLAGFYHRHALFEKEASTLERLIWVVPAENRSSLLQRLITLAKIQNLERYLKPDFYQTIIEQDPTVCEIIQRFISTLEAENYNQEALKIVRQFKPHFPQQRNFFVEKEASLLVTLGNEKEAEKVYLAELDSEWTDELASSFYSFLGEQDRFRGYGSELKVAFQKNPGNFKLAVKLLHYLKHTGQTESTTGVIARLEKARSQRHQSWKPEELVTFTHFLIQNGNVDEASRYLYTLCLQNNLKPGDPLRAKVLYQLFELLMDVQTRRLALTKDDLKFYQDIARADSHPGLLGAVLSLIFSDSEPKSKFEQAQEKATKYFNRASAYRIFTIYKQENPTSPELGQMYLDMVRLYTSEGEPQRAEEMLTEFEKRYQDAPDFPEVALKLADSYIAVGQFAREQNLYQQILDYFGKHRKPGTFLIPVNQSNSSSLVSEPCESKPVLLQYPPKTNPGINHSDQDEESSDFEGEDGYQTYHDFLDLKKEAVSYSTVLERYVASLAKEKRNQDILALYANEVKKYPQDQGLYEQWLQWLGQTNFLDEQLRVYQETVKQFPSTLWHDRLARWFLRHERKQEFETFSRDLFQKLNDKEIESYLSRFVESRMSSTESSFDANLYLGLYTLAHQRFPHNLKFVQGLLNFYTSHHRWREWRNLMAEYYFESKDIREQFLSYLAGQKELRDYLNRARAKCTSSAKTNPSDLGALPYKLFRADAAVWLSNYEEAIDAYRELTLLYPNTPEFSERLVAFTRSFGQRNRKFLEEAANLQHSYADANPASEELRTRSGEIYAELGDYTQAKGEWEQLIKLGRGDPETYLNTATLYWDYFQYDDAVRTIEKLRQNLDDHDLYAFQMGAILEAKHKLPQALSEYLKALDEQATEYKDRRNAKQRLVTLYQRPGIPEQLHRAFEAERHRRDEPCWLVLGYAELLKEVDELETANHLLQQEVIKNDSQAFLNRARQFFQEAENPAGEIKTLSRLSVFAKSPRFAISYQLQLAQLYHDQKNLIGANQVLHKLVQQFPGNFGVLTESADAYWRMGFHQNAIQVLQGGYQRGKGKYRYTFARKLAARYLDDHHLAEAETILKRLYQENHLDSEVFHELARVYVKSTKTQALESMFRESAEAIKKQDEDIQVIRFQIAELRKEMIGAFTQLGDYQAAVEQHIEIINREPEDEEKLNAALDYVKRYGGAEKLLTFYQQTAQQAYKNYRWNLVLARIYEAKGDLPNAAQQYRTALVNQPEMVELHRDLAGICLRMKDLSGAIQALTKAVELSNDDPQYLKLLADALEKAGRHQEAQLVRQKLPQTPPPKRTIEDEFAEAERLRSSERTKAVAAYRAVFDKFVTDPYQYRLKSGEITGYVQTVRSEETLDRIAQRLWDLREKLVVEVARPNNAQWGKAHELLQTLDYGIIEGVGGTASKQATGDELAELFKDFQKRIDAALQHPDQFGTLSLLQSLSHRAGFSALEEKILTVQKDGAFSSGQLETFHVQVRSLVNFYVDQGHFQKALEILETEFARDPKRKDFEYLRLMAEYARLLEYRDKELTALRTNYQQATGSLRWQTDPLIDRYFQILYENGDPGKAELRECVNHGSPFQVQLINFLLAKGEGELAHLAIEKTPVSEVWKHSRHAEMSLALQEFDPARETHFLNALHLKPIGEMVSHHPDTSQELVGDDWFSLTEILGQWRYLSPKTTKSETGDNVGLLMALIENRPKDTAEQVRLGRWYLNQKNPRQAIQHFNLALETASTDKKIMAELGDAYWLLGDKAKAQEQWAHLLSDASPTLEECDLYLHTLSRHGLAEEARNRLFLLVVSRLKKITKDGEYINVNQENTDFVSLKPLIRALSDSFKSETDPAKPLSLQAETGRADFFNRMCETVPQDMLLSKFLIDEELIGKAQRVPFYERLIAQSQGFSQFDCDYQFNDQLQTSSSEDQIEEILDHSNAYKVTETENKRVVWEKAYLEYLMNQPKNSEAFKVLISLEAEFRKRYARPAWLRLARCRLEIRSGEVGKVFLTLKHFVGIETIPNLTKIQSPSSERLASAVALLNEEHQAGKAEELLQAAYERCLALEQYKAPNFVGLAQIAFQHHDAQLGLKLLDWMTRLAKEDTSSETINEITNSNWVKIRAIDDPKIEKPESQNTIQFLAALQLAAETASENGQLAAALAYRERLFRENAMDETNRIELIRLLAANQKNDEAIQNLAAILSDRTATRQTRWLAVWLSPEIVGNHVELWNSLEQRLQATRTKDREILVAVKAISLASTGKMREAIEIFSAEQTTFSNPYATFFKALLEKRNQQLGEALADFSQTLTVHQAFHLEHVFGITEDPSLRQMIRLYAQLGKPRAALKLAGQEHELLTSFSNTSDAETNSEVEENETPSVKPEGSVPAPWLSLETRSSHRRSDTQLELLETLSEAAEHLGDIGKAIDFERARMDLLPDSDRKRTAKTRLKHLTTLQSQRSNQKQSNLILDQKLLANR